jgi:hypothetical protein
MCGVVAGDPHLASVRAFYIESGAAGGRRYKESDSFQKVKLAVELLKTQLLEDPVLAI